MTRRKLRLFAIILVAAGAVVAISLAATTRFPRQQEVASYEIVGAGDAHLSPEFWVAKLERPDRVVFDRASIEAQNAALMQSDPSMHDLKTMPTNLDRQRIRDWINELAGEPAEPLYDAAGRTIPAGQLDGIVENRNMDGLAEQPTTRFGLVVRRADLRAFPTRQRVYRSPDSTDIDRFQETALFPGTPVAVVHESRDGNWYFVVSPRYAAWVEKTVIALGPRDEVLEYQDKTPYRIVTGSKVETVFTPEQTALSELELDMGVRVPVAAKWAADAPVNGQHPYNAHVIELPVRTADGNLLLAPALVQRNAATAGDYLPLTQANIIRQGFKFLGERYGWGHSYNGRDCSGFVSEVYRSMGIQMPRNTSDQSVSPGLQKHLFSETDDSDARMAAAHSLEVGDLVYIPGHVMMVIGQLDGEPWVIHDTTGVSYRQAEGETVRIKLNAVSVTPFLPLRFNDEERYVDRMTSIVRVAPHSIKDAAKPL